MIKVNANITSEIRNLLNTSEEMKEFLIWLIEFEKNNSDKDRYSYKKEIESKLEELFLRTPKDPEK